MTTKNLHGQWLEGSPLDFHLSGPRSDQVVLDSALVYQSPGGLVLEVPVGSVVDLASVPRFIRPLMPHWPQSAQAGTLHDMLYRWSELQGVSRKLADRLFHHALRLDEADAVQAWLMWIGVRLGGWRSWNRWRRTDPGLKGIQPPPPRVG